ncbi:hypothetical protein [Undibacterium oligocarboniphilum]|uniref:Uncharacterized protein n=1 Tax=Undibacterium oligocarboniphilum TaxID=666702 RepID=A0A850QH80_9BURK|nr:hypothetical protein [Undibacterium oligocarboniphilum]MBC3871483.1 hypothetical protein [Undibacterium oligocarboniphilum]NVO78941.1 hypothetical protein [Undibacterium oligocarboniphilum]
MTLILLTLLAQACITSADVFVKKHIALQPSDRQRTWILPYALRRYTGLCLRLFAIFMMPVAGAATLFSASAISLSSAVAWYHGEQFSAREKLAVGLILAAVLIRGLA